MADLLANDLGDPAKEQRMQWPPGNAESTWNRLQPLLTPLELRQIHLFGIPLVSGEADPITKQRTVMTDPVLEYHIEKAVEIAEAETGLTIMPTFIKERLPFDRPAWSNFGYFQLSRRPCYAVRQLTIQTSDGADIYTVSNAWITTGGMHRGQINIIPLTLAFVGTSISPGPATGGAGAAFLAAIGGLWWTSEFWSCQYVSGFCDGMVPVLVNDLVGCIASMEILSQLAATNARVTSASIGVDGLSQSTGLAAGSLYVQRLKELAEKRTKLVKKIRHVFGLGIVMGTL